MKPGIYLIEVKECAPREVGLEFCDQCKGLGYTETRIEAEAWLLSMLGRVEWTNATGFMDVLPSTEKMVDVRFVEAEDK